MGCGVEHVVDELLVSLHVPTRQSSISYLFFDLLLGDIR